MGNDRMTRITLRRALPGLAALSLLVLAAASPAPRGARPAPPSPAAATCDPFSQTGPGDSFVALFNDAGIRQPFPAGLPVSACSLRVQGTGWSYANARMIEWDPIAMAPDPTTIALRAAFCDPSDLQAYTVNAVPRLTFVPPIVTQSLAGVAEAPRTTIAVEIKTAPYFANYPFQGYYAPEGDPAMPTASVFGPAGSHGDIAGSHPVAAHALCAGDEDLATLRVAQSVRRVDAAAPAPSDELVQRFRVPEPVELRWVELAVNELAVVAPGSSPGDAESRPVPPVIVGVADASAYSDPPATMPPTLVESGLTTFFYKQPGPRWASPLDFDQSIVLMPGRDYWLYLRSAAGYQFLSRALDGNESADFTSSIGAFHFRAHATDPWTAIPAQALAFKLVGAPTAPLSAPPRTTFQLRISPNPARESAEVSWSGAVGPVRLEVFDARGRRVATAEGGAAGSWRMAVRGAGAKPLPAGVYFVHARDSEGSQPV